MFLILFLAILLSGLALLTGLILSVSGLASDKPKLRNAGFITFGIAFVSLIISIYFAVTGVVQTVKENVVEPFSDLADSLNSYSEQSSQNGLFDDNRAYLLSDTSSNKQFKYIKEASDKKTTGIPNSFYTYFGSQGFARMPLIFPLAIHCLDSKDIGMLVDETNVADIATTPGGEENLVFNVAAVNYDENVVLMRVMRLNTETNRDVASYTLYSVKERKSSEYQTEAELFKAAAKQGYKGEKILISLWDYDAMF